MTGKEAIDAELIARVTADKQAADQRLTRKVASMSDGQEQARSIELLTARNPTKTRLSPSSCFLAKL
jgi:hypothetical protein